jgi:subtilisin family serine protease
MKPILFTAFSFLIFPLGVSAAWGEIGFALNTHAAKTRFLAHLLQPTAISLSPPPSIDSPNLAALPSSAWVSLQKLGQRFQCSSVSRLTPWDLSEGTLVLEFSEIHDPRVLIEAYQSTGLFDWIEPDGQGMAQGQRSFHGLAKMSAIPNDPNYGSQYALKNDGSRTFGGVLSKAGADIEAELAWDIQKGNAEILVAVLDGGIALNHPELKDRIWTNTDEIAGNGVDDDGNGFIDDVHGWNFAVTGSGGNANVADEFGHGTNVAGIIGSISENGVGVAGVTRCTLMPVKVLDGNDQGLYSWWAAGIRYAVDQGARVLNLSLGGTDPGSRAMESAVQYALSKNVALVVSMGNERSDVPNYPAVYAGVIAVGASGPDDHWVKSFPWDTTMGSNFGEHLSVIAPGNFIYGLDYQDQTNYRSYWSGTSQAAPMVAGVCALLLAQKSDRTPAELKLLIEAGAEDGVGAISLDTPGWDPYYGHGRLNAYRSLLAGVSIALRPRREEGEMYRRRNREIGFGLRGFGFFSDVLGRSKQTRPSLGLR